MYDNVDVVREMGVRLSNYLCLARIPSGLTWHG